LEDRSEETISECNLKRLKKKKRWNTQEGGKRYRR
jgi:hypothetical protein